MLRIITIFVGLLLCGAGTLAHAGEAGRVVFVTGEARLSQQAATLDAAIHEGDELSTGADGYIYMKTIDSGFLILRPNSKARITAYHIDSEHPANTRVKLELLNGVARSISGLGVKQARQNFRFNTPVAAIGVRGTDFIVYTNQEVSRVTVISGGVIMSGFIGSCGPEGSGPCDGSASRELFAGQAGALLQIERGQKIPQLLRNPSLSPDQNAAPRPDEPVGKVVSAPPLPTADLSLDAQKAVLVHTAPAVNGSGASSGNQNDVTPPVVVAPPVVGVSPPVVTPPVVTPPVVTPPVVVAPPVVTPPVVVAPPVEVPRSAPEVFWGRWQAVAVAGLAPTDPTMLTKLSALDVTDRVLLGPYVMARFNDATFVMPQDGVGAFALASSEAIMQKAGQAGVSAAVGNGRLNVDFAAQTFNTSLTVTALGSSVVVNGVGQVSERGALLNTPLSDSIIRGFLGGAHAEEAGYLFQNTATPGITVTGVTKWTR